MDGKFVRGGGGLALLLASSLGLFASACLERPLCSDCEPKTTNQFVLRVPTGGIDKVDLLFVIDNSASMADKQAILRQAVPSLLARFVNPLCVDEHGTPTGASSQAGKCDKGVPEFPALTDIHIGVITSSLGAAGSMNACSRGDSASDRAWLLPLSRAGSGLDSWNQSGFLAWDPTQTRNVPPGTRDPRALTASFQNQVRVAGETGCGFESTLESWYRFLIAPDPPKNIARQGLVSVPEGVDDELLKQRNAFLRPDSLLAVVMLTDENDCSLISAGQGFLVDDAARMPRASSSCASNPNDPCCRPCGGDETTPPAGCVPLASDPECKLGSLPLGDDPKNLRCWDQKHRFGLDLLEPTSKYIAGLTQEHVPDRSGKLQPNPLFAVRNGKKRTPDLVYLAGIVGVPWQDIATKESLTGPNLRYMSAKELSENGRWDVILGDPGSRKPPTDPHMRESISARTGSNPLVPNATIAPADAATPPTADVISGHEQAPPLRDDLQYACIFELETPVTCSGDGCDCPTPPPSDPTDTQNKKRPLCQPPGGGAFGATQYFAKAYPGTRHLEVLKGLGEQAIVASICPKLPRAPNPEGDPNYGYNPAMAAMVDRIGVRLGNQCLARAPAVDGNGKSACVILEVALSGACDCSGAGRHAPLGDVVDTVRADLRESRSCGNAQGQVPCESVCACQIDETAGTAQDRCRAGADPSSEQPGFCVIDPDAGRGDPALVRDCPATARRLLRFVGADTPRAGTMAYMACLGDTLTSSR